VPDIRFRHATADDVAAIARLHAQSWREHCRGAYSDVFLDGEALADRLAVWGGRLPVFQENGWSGPMRGTQRDAESRSVAHWAVSDLCQIRESERRTTQSCDSL
jgi:hypothetical protein